MYSMNKFRKRIGISLKSKFNERDQNLILDFSSQFFEEVDALKKNEEQAYLALPTYLYESADLQLRANAEWIKIRGHLLLAGASPISVVKRWGQLVPQLNINNNNPQPIWRNCKTNRKSSLDRPVTFRYELLKQIWRLKKQFGKTRVTW